MLVPVELTTAQLCAYATAAGTLSHWTYFAHGEHHAAAPRLLSLSIFLPVLICVILWRAGSFTLEQAGTMAMGLTGSFFGGLWTSIVIYRLLFHRLRSFSGPLLARTSKLWHVWKVLPNFDNFRQLDELHRKYGDFVRTGKNHLWDINKTRQSRVMHDTEFSCKARTRYRFSIQKQSRF